MPRSPANATALGITLVLLSAIGLASQNVVLRLFFAPSLLWGKFSTGGWVTSTLGNVMLLLALRMTMMAVMLAIIALRLYPETFTALRQLPKTPKILSSAVGSGLCLFVGLSLLYLALSQVEAGVAIATFFIYPVVTVLLSWRFLGQRPYNYQLWLMLIIFFGVALTTLDPSTDKTSNLVLGSLSALGAGLSFGLYGIFAELALKSQPSGPTFHPVPFSLLTFTIVASFASLSVLVGPQIEIIPTVWFPILGMSLLSAALTLVAYILNNFGIRYIGGALTALISASTPVLTTVFAAWALQEILQKQQLIGIVLVTLGVTALSLKSRP